MLGVDERGWGFEFSTETPSDAFSRSFSQPANLPLSEADKEEQHPAGGQHAPGGWGIIPLYRVGGVEGGRHEGLRGFVSASAYLYTYKLLCRFPDL